MRKRLLLLLAALLLSLPAQAAGPEAAPAVPGEGVFQNGAFVGPQTIPHVPPPEAETLAPPAGSVLVSAVLFTTGWLALWPLAG